jgi:hypothetical protein
MDTQVIAKGCMGITGLLKLRVKGNNTNEIGMVIDFKDIKNNLQELSIN